MSNKVRAKSKRIRATRATIAPKLKLQWWNSKQRQAFYTRLLMSCARKYQKATKGYKFTPLPIFFYGRILIEVESGRHPKHGFLSTKRLSVSYRDIFDKRIVAICKDMWRQEDDEVKAFEALPYMHEELRGLS